MRLKIILVLKLIIDNIILDKYYLSIYTDYYQIINPHIYIGIGQKIVVYYHYKSNVELVNLSTFQDFKEK